ncbi:MAG: hypothetical protein WBP81_14615 [Solirubrobacteraceae bacterium]
MVVLALPESRDQEGEDRQHHARAEDQRPRPCLSPDAGDDRADQDGRDENPLPDHAVQDVRRAD